MISVVTERLVAEPNKDRITVDIREMKWRKWWPYNVLSSEPNEILFSHKHGFALKYLLVISFLRDLKFFSIARDSFKHFCCRSNLEHILSNISNFASFIWSFVSYTVRRDLQRNAGGRYHDNFYHNKHHAEQFFHSLCSLILSVWRCLTDNHTDQDDAMVNLIKNFRILFSIV